MQSMKIKPAWHGVNKYSKMKVNQNSKVNYSMIIFSLWLAHLLEQADPSITIDTKAVVHEKAGSYQKMTSISPESK